MSWKIGSKIAELRKFNNMTQVQLAEDLHIGEKTLRKIESNITPIRLDLLTDICKAFDIEVIYFFNINDNVNGRIYDCNCEMSQKYLAISKIINNC